MLPAHFTHTLTFTSPSSPQPPVGSLTGIDGYRVTISPPHPDGRALLDLPLTQTTLVLSNLNFFTEYTFQVAVYNELGNGPFTDPVSATTGEGGGLPW